MEATLDDHLIDVFLINENRGKLVTWYVVSASDIVAFTPVSSPLASFTQRSAAFSASSSIFLKPFPPSPLDDTLTGGKITILPKDIHFSGFLVFRKCTNRLCCKIIITTHHDITRIPFGKIF